MSINAVLEPQLHSDIPGRNFCQSIGLTGAILSISENLRSKGLTKDWQNDSFGSIPPYIPSGNFCHWKKTYWVSATDGQKEGIKNRQTDVGCQVI